MHNRIDGRIINPALAEYIAHETKDLEEHHLDYTRKALNFGKLGIDLFFDHPDASRMNFSLQRDYMAMAHNMRIQIDERTVDILGGYDQVSL